MHAVITDHLDELAELCRRYNVERLEVFGSAATGQFDPERSDVDLLVRFGPWEGIGALRQYMDFLFGCEDLFGRHVDLVEEGAIRNPYFRKSVNKHRTVVYDR